MSTEKKTNLAIWVLIGAVSGILTGVFFGEGCTVFKPIGSAYVMLLQSVVYPYLIASLLHGLGRMSQKNAIRLFKRGWYFYILLWAGVFGAIFLLAQSLPSRPFPTAIDATITHESGISLLSIILPANFFSDIANNYVPAVVVFAILYGIAIQKYNNKEGFLAILALIKNASVTIWGWVVKLAPFAVFAMFAHTAGTVHPQELATLFIYIGAFLFGSLFLAFYTLPALIASMAPTKYREVLSDLQSAFVLSAVTTLSVAALPFIMESAKKLVKSAGIDDQKSNEIIETNLAISYSLGQLGNFFVYLFILFAAYHFHAAVTGMKSIALPFLTFMSCIGSPSSTVNAVGFLGSWLGLPSGTMNLYVETMMLTRYGQVLLSVAGFAFLTFLITLSFFGRLKIRPAKIVSVLLISLAVIGLFAYSMRTLSQSFLPGLANKHLAYNLSKKITNGVEAEILLPPKGFSAGRKKILPEEGVMDRINRSHTLYVGYNNQIVPYSYLNKNGKLVGYDIAFAYELAKSLNVKLKFVPFIFSNLVDELKKGRFDIAMSGTYMTNDRMKILGISKPYYQSEMGLIVQSENAGDFLSMDDILEMANLKIACLDDHELNLLAKEFFPGATIILLNNYSALTKAKDIDAAMWTFTQAAKFAALNPEYTAVKPKGMGGGMICAYLMPPDSNVFLVYINRFMEMKKVDGFTGDQLDYWINGKRNGAAPPRWSIMNDVLGW